MSPACECPVMGGMDHDGPCPRPSDRTVRRGDRILHLCGMCDLSGDVRLDCEQGCGQTATVYAIDPMAGGWGGRYCTDCAHELGFRVTDRLT